MIEIKAPDKKAKETLASALEEAMAQLNRNKYDAGLREAGTGHIRRIAIAVQGKKVKMAVC